jgi:hypothetical protein
VGGEVAVGTKRKREEEGEDVKMEEVACLLA